MADIEEDRIFRDSKSPETLYIGSDIGLVKANASNSRLGKFGIIHRGEIHDLTVMGDRIVVATGEGVGIVEGESIHNLGLGSADAVGHLDGHILASTGGSLMRYRDGSWREICYIDEIRAIGGRLLASASGIYRLPSCKYAGLGNAYDVSDAGPYAATEEGIFRLANGWVLEKEGLATAIEVSNGRTGAVVNGKYLERDSDWFENSTPTEERIVDLAFGESTYLVSAEGTLLAAESGSGEWRSHLLGVSNVTSLAIC
ncbi:MAG: hypothetical protein ABEI52_11970 [Halobacteriaceae archaeon]